MDPFFTELLKVGGPSIVFSLIIVYLIRSVFMPFWEKQLDRMHEMRERDATQHLKLLREIKVTFDEMHRTLERLSERLARKQAS